MHRLAFASVLLSTICLSFGYMMLNSGGCPHIDQQRGLDMNKFLGIWYVIRRDRTDVNCIRQNVTTDGNRYFITEVKESIAKGQFATSKKEIYDDNRQRSLYHDGANERMSPLIIFMTDYDNYAVTWSCVKSTFGHKQSVSILSRDNTLGRAYMSKISKYVKQKMGISTQLLSKVNQNDCEEPELNHLGYVINKPFKYDDYLHQYQTDFESDPEHNDDKYWR